MRERAWPSVKLLAPGSTEPVLCGLPAGLTSTAGFEVPVADGVVVLVPGCIVDDGPPVWASAAVDSAAAVRVTRTRRMGLPSVKGNALLMCDACPGSAGARRRPAACGRACRPR